MLCDRLERDSTSPTFHHDNFCCCIFSVQSWGSGSSERGCGGGSRVGAMRRRRRLSFFPLPSPPELPPRVRPPRGREHREPCKATLLLIEYSIFKITLRN